MTAVCGARSSRMEDAQITVGLSRPVPEHSTVCHHAATRGDLPEGRLQLQPPRAAPHRSFQSALAV